MFLFWGGYMRLYYQHNTIVILLIITLLLILSFEFFNLLYGFRISADTT